MEMKCYRKILRISYKDHVTNEEVCAKIQQAIGPHEDLLTTVKRHKLKWRGEEDEADRKRSGKTASGNGRAWSSSSPRWRWKTEKNGGNWFELICGAPTTPAVKG